MAVKQKIPCPRCDGRGIIPQYYYNRKGICFLCWGAKYVTVKIPNGKTVEQVQKELIAKEKPDFKTNPVKAEMPHKDQIKNPSYFPQSNSKVEALEKAVKENESKKSKFNFSDYKSLDAIQIQEKIQRDYKDSSTKDLKALAEEMYAAQKGEDDEVYRVATAAAKGFENLIKSKEGYSSEELSGIKARIHKNYGDESDIDFLTNLMNDRLRRAESEENLLAKQKATAEAEAYKELIEAKKAEAEAAKGQENAVRAAIRDQAKDADAATLMKMKEKLASDAHKESNTLKKEMLFAMADEVQKMYREKAPKPKKAKGVPALPYNDDVFKDFNPSRAREYREWYTARTEERKNSPEGLRELMEHYDRYASVRIKDSKYLIETELTAADMRQIDEALKSVGLSSWDKHNGTAEQYRNLLKKLKSPEFSENRYLGKSGLESFEKLLDRAESREMYADFAAKYLPKSDSDSNYINYADYTEEELARALYHATEIEKEDVRDRAIKNIQAAIERRNKNLGVDTARAEAKKRNEAIDKKREEIVTNISRNTDTEIGRKVAEMAAKGVKTPEDAIAIGELVAARLEENMQELGVDYVDFAKKYKAYRDEAIKLEALEEELKKVSRRRYDARVGFEKREEAHRRYEELQPIVQKKLEEVTKLRRGTYVYEAKIKKIKEQAYLKTMKEIRAMGGAVAFTEESTKAARNKEVIANVASVTDTFPKEWLEASSETPIHIGDLRKDGREYSRGESKWQANGTKLELDGGVLGITGETSRSTLIHELQHRLEETNPRLQDLMRKFYISKVSNRKTGKIKKPKTIPGYSSREKYIEVADGGNKWVTEYMGKFYGWGDDPATTRGWEIGTLTMESLVLDKIYGGKRVEFYQEDVYKFMLGVLAGV